MRYGVFAVPFAFLFAMLGLAQATKVPAQQTDAITRTRSFLDAYALGDNLTVMRAVDEDTVFYGSDSGEVFRGPSEVGAMFADDKLLWAGQARIGEMRDISHRSSGNLQTVFFQAPFTIAGRPPLQVRFCVVWRRKAGRWYVLQSSNAVVTEGQSAKQLLKGAAGGK